MAIVCHAVDPNPSDAPVRGRVDGDSEADLDLVVRLQPEDEKAHPSSVSEEWTFGWWSARGDIAGYTSYRLVGQAQAWYCWGLWRRERPLVHITEFDIPRRADPMIAKASAMWAEFTCDAPFEQWTLGNETYAVELDDPNEALDRAYGHAVPIASDLEWYATEGITRCPDGYAQRGRLLGSVETIEGPVTFEDLHAHRTHRWSAVADLEETRARHVIAHLGPRLPFRFPNGVVRDLFLTPEGLQVAPLSGTT